MTADGNWTAYCVCAKEAAQLHQMTPLGHCKAALALQECNLHSSFCLAATLVSSCARPELEKTLAGSLRTLENLAAASQPSTVPNKHAGDVACTEHDILPWALLWAGSGAALWCWAVILVGTFGLLSVWVCLRSGLCRIMQ